MLAIFATYKPQTRIFDDFSLYDEQERHRKQQADLRQKRAIFKKSVESGEWADGRKNLRGQQWGPGRGRGRPHHFGYQDRPRLPPPPHYQVQPQRRAHPKQDKPARNDVPQRNLKRVTFEEDANPPVNQVQHHAAPKVWKRKLEK